MSDLKSSDLSQDEATDRVWELAASIGTCMLSTWDGKHQKSRPMAATVKRDDHAIYFLTDSASEKLRHLAEFSSVAALFADVGSNKFVAFSGEASVGDDRAKIKQLWTPFAKAWWTSADDPAIRLVTLRPDGAELWDSPNKLVAYAVMLTAVVGGKQRPKLGNNATVQL